MRVKLINAVTKTEMWVAEDRVNDYIAAGNTLAAEKKSEPVEKPAAVPKAKKSTTKKK